MKRTVLYDKHVALGAKMAEFGGYLMPIQYQGIVAEHMAARQATAIFDTCHMGEFLLSGPQAAEFLERLLSCRVADLAAGRCRYGLLCNEAGGVIDDQVLYRLGPDEFMMVVNAGTQDADFAWLERHRPAGGGLVLRNLSDATGKLDIQGPASVRLVQELAGISLADLGFYSFRRCRCRGVEITVSRTGYTGEIGYEIYCPAPRTGEFWDAAVALGAVPAGLGCRDTLRLEMGMPLYGHELGADRPALASGFNRAICLDKDFIGAPALRAQAAGGGGERLVCMRLEDRRAARAGDAIETADGRCAGVVTSGSFAPSIGVAVAMGYVSAVYAAPETALLLRGARAALPATVVPPPFYREATGRQPASSFI